MRRKFEYMLIGALLTLFVIGAAFAVGLSQTEAQSELAVAEQAEANEPDSSLSAAIEKAPETIAFDSVLIADDEPSQEAIEAPGSHNDDELEPGTITDPAQIVTTLKAFAARHEAALLGQPGWILVRRMEVASDEQRQGEYSSPTGVSVPFVGLVPAESPIFEGWTRVDEQGLYHEALGLVTSADGAIHQHSVLFDGQWVHVTLRAKGFPQEQYRSPHSFVRVHLPTSETAHWLEEIQDLDNVSLTAYVTDGKYTVVKEGSYKEPLDLDTPRLPAPALGDKTTYTFDTETGQLLSEEVYFLLQDGSAFLAGRSEYYTEFMLELPIEKALLYYEVVNAIKGEQ